MSTHVMLFPETEATLVSSRAPVVIPPKAEVLPGFAPEYHFMRYRAHGLEWELHSCPMVADLEKDRLIIYIGDRTIDGPLSDLDWIEGALDFECWTAWVKSGSTPRLQLVRITEGFGTETNPFVLLGLTVMAAAKTSKRLKEVIRATQAVWVRELVIKELNDEILPHFASDGRGAMAISTFIEGINNSSMPESHKTKLIHQVRTKQITTAKFRLYGPKGMLKLEINLVDDGVFGNKHGHFVDLAIHSGEWKTGEVRSKRGVIGHAWVETTTYGPAILDIQTASWMGEAVFPLELMQLTQSKVLEKTINDLTVAGRIPEHLKAKMIINDDGLLEVNDDLSRVQDVSKMWTAMGLDVRSSANILFMAGMGQYSQVLSRDVWAPIPWAGWYHVCSDRFVEELCGLRVLHKGRLHYDPRVGCVVYPAKLWSKDARFFGGADFDGDTLRIMFRRDGDRIVAIVYRNPNAPGEYRVITDVVFESFPVFYHGIENNPEALPDFEMPSVDLSNMPKDLDAYRGQMNIVEMNHEDASKFGGEWDFKAMCDQIQVEVMNPGVGGTANMWMVLADAGIVPEWAHAMEDVVDYSMQKPDRLAFDHMREWLEYAGTLLSGKRIDRVLAGTHHVAGQLRAPKARVPRKVLSTMNQYDGYFSQLRSSGINAAVSFLKELEGGTFKVRCAWPLAGIGPMVDPELQLSPTPGVPTSTLFNKFSKEKVAELMIKAKALINVTAGITEKPAARGKFVSFKQVSYTYPRHRDFADPTNRAKRSEANKMVVRASARALLRLPVDERDAVLIMAYRYAATPEEGTEFRNGRSDRILFSALPDGEISPFQMFLRALERYGVASSDAVWSQALRQSMAEAFENLQ